MQATLIYNPKAGAQSDLTDEILTALEEAGFTPKYTPTDDEDELDAVLRHAQGLVLLAGGDGTVGLVAKRLLGRDLPLSILPLGTANNIARTFGLNDDLQQGEVKPLIRGLEHPHRTRFDIGRVVGPWGEQPFLEAVGIGLVPRVMATHAAQQDKEPGNVLRLLKEILPDYEPQHYNLTLDDQDLSGAYLLIEAMNIRSIRPRLTLAPHARTDDGLLELVLVKEAHRDALMRLVETRLAGNEPAAPPGMVLRGRHLRLQLDQVAVHVDDDVWLEERWDQAAADRAVPANKNLDVRMEQGALELWLPT